MSWPLEACEPVSGASTAISMGPLVDNAPDVLVEVPERVPLFDAVLDVADDDDPQPVRARPTGRIATARAVASMRERGERIDSTSALVCIKLHTRSSAGTAVDCARSEQDAEASRPGGMAALVRPTLGNPCLGVVTSLTRQEIPRAGSGRVDVVIGATGGRISPRA